MSKKRKRHQNGEDWENTNEVAQPITEIVSPDNEETVHPKILSPEEVELVQKKVFHALKEMGRTFKKARDFEIRKIIKRIKSAKFILSSLITDSSGRWTSPKSCYAWKRNC